MSSSQLQTNWVDPLKEPINFQPGAYPGVLHHYSARLTAFEHTPFPPGHRPSREKPHAVIFIGGLYDGLLTVPFVPPLAESLAPTKWSLFSILLSSSYAGFGTSSLSNDSNEIAKCIAYIRNHKRQIRPDAPEPCKIVLMGHSTGSQDALHYCIYNLPTGPAIQGVILQAAVSDQESTRASIENDAEKTRLFNDTLATARDMFAQNPSAKPKPLLPRSATKPFYGNAPMTAERFLSLLDFGYDPPALADDLFGTGASAAQLVGTFGRIGKGVRVCVLLSGADEHVPAETDKRILLRMWAWGVKEGGESVWDESSGIVAGARHALDGSEQEGQRRELEGRVGAFLGRVESD